MLDLERCWQAVCERDSSHDGQFVFAVHSTGIYCRPSCPARRPLRNNVSFHPNAAEAEAAGFRPCKRCSPQGQSPAELVDSLVVSACQLLTQAEQPLTLNQLASRIGLSPSHLARAFKARLGVTPRAWAAAQRSTQGETQESRSKRVLAARLHSKRPAIKPTTRQQKGAGLKLRYCISPCPLGYLLLAATDKGICALLFGDSPAAVEAEFSERFNAAERQIDAVGLADWLQQVVRQIEQPARAAHLPLDLQGTAFQQRVWQALQGIESGQTRNYAELAAQLGTHPRALASACARNPVGLLVPCHRVVASTGALSGYRWGIERKARLLTDERQALQSPEG